MTFRAVNVLAIFIVGCGCEAAGYGARDADAVKNNERAVADALARAGWVLVAPQALMTASLNVSEPTVLDSAQLSMPPGKLVLVFPASSGAPSLVRDQTGKVLRIVDVKHEVKETRGGRVCGCGPYVGGGTPPPPPSSWWVPVDTKDAWGGDVTIVARGWIDLAYTYPDSNNRGCREIP